MDLSAAENRFPRTQELNIHCRGEILRSHLLDEIVSENSRAVHYAAIFSITRNNFLRTVPTSLGSVTSHLKYAASIPEDRSSSTRSDYLNGFGNPRNLSSACSAVRPGLRSATSFPITSSNESRSIAAPEVYVRVEHGSS